MKDFRAEHIEAETIQPIKKRNWLNRTTFCNIAFLSMVPAAIELATLFGSALIFLFSILILPFVIAFFNPVKYTEDRKCFDSYGEDITEKTGAGALAWLIFIINIAIIIGWGNDLIRFFGFSPSAINAPILSFISLLLPVSILILSNIPVAVCLQKDPYEPKQPRSTHKSIFKDDNRFTPGLSHLPSNIYHRK